MKITKEKLKQIVENIMNESSVKSKNFKYTNSNRAGVMEFENIDCEIEMMPYEIDEALDLFKSINKKRRKTTNPRSYMEYGLAVEFHDENSGSFFATYQDLLEMKKIADKDYNDENYYYDDWPESDGIKPKYGPLS